MKSEHSTQAWMDKRTEILRVMNCYGSNEALTMSTEVLAIIITLINKSAGISKEEIVSTVMDALEGMLCEIDSSMEKAGIALRNMPLRVH